jgi:hypothetical protein
VENGRGEPLWNPAAELQTETANKRRQTMPPRGVKSAKRTRQYEKIKSSAKKRGRSGATAKRIAAATVNMQRRETGETKSSGRKQTSAKKSSATSSARKSSARKSSAKKKSSRKR